MYNKVISNLIWRFLERCGAQIVTFIVSIVLARILSPDEYGQIAIIIVIINILNVFVDGGFANSLIQKKDSDQLDFSTVFYFNLLICFLLYVIVFIGAPFIGYFYNDNELIPLTRVLALTIILSSIKNTQQAYVSKKFLFKKFFFATIGGTIISAIIGIIMALSGFGVWALVVQHLCNTFIDTCILWFTVKWRPTQEFSINRLKILFSYGYKLLLSTLLNTLYSNFRQLVIGKVYSSSDLAFYNRGKQFPSLIMTNINSSIDSVLFPAMSEKQDNIDEVKGMIKKSINISTFVLWPFLFGLCAISSPFIELVLTKKWLPCVPFLQVMCFVFATFPIQTANLNALKAVGRSDLFFKIEIEQTIIGLSLLIAVYKISPMWIAIMYLISSCFNCFIICHESKKIFGYGLFSQMRDIMKNLLYSIIMMFVVYAIYYIYPLKYIIIIQIPVGIIIYIFWARITKDKNLEYVLKLFNTILNKRKNS